MRSTKLLLIIFSALLLKTVPVCAQFKIRGTVYDSSRNYPLELVSVVSTSGNGTVTNINGEYEIEVLEKDSIWFSYLNKPTVKFPVLKISSPLAFDISLKVNIGMLKEVKIRQRNYKQDSIQNREDYAKAFNYQKPGLSTVTGQSAYGGAVGFGLEELISVFQFKRNKRKASFQKRLLAQEKDKFVDHRFNKALVRKLTLLEEPALDSFMAVFRPSYLFSTYAGEYDFQKYIKDSYERFTNGLYPLEAFKFEPEDDF